MNLHSSFQRGILDCKMKIESLKSQAEEILDEIRREEVLAKRHCFCSRWRRLNNCHVQNLREDQVSTTKKIEVHLQKIEELQAEELREHQRLQDEHEEVNPLDKVKTEFKGIFSICNIFSKYCSLYWVP